MSTVRHLLAKVVVCLYEIHVLMTDFHQLLLSRIQHFCQLRQFLPTKTSVIINSCRLSRPTVFYCDFITTESHTDLPQILTEEHTRTYRIQN